MKKPLLNVAGIACCVCSFILILSVFLNWLDCYPRYLAFLESVEEPGTALGYGVAGIIIILIWLISSVFFAGNAILDLVLGIRILKRSQNSGKQTPGIRSAFFIMVDLLSILFLILNAFMQNQIPYFTFLVFAMLLLASSVLRVVAAVQARKTKPRPVETES